MRAQKNKFQCFVVCQHYHTFNYKKKNQLKIISVEYKEKLIRKKYLKKILNVKFRNN